jgi:hypothetical protein
MIDADDVCSILAPTAITAGMITSMTANGVAVPDDTNPLWLAGTDYSAAGQRVYLASTQRVYESTGKTGNVGKDPSLPANQFDAAGVATYWIDAAPTNKYAMFDGLVSTQTATASPFVQVLKPGYFNGFALFGLDADTIHVVVKDAPGGNVIYEYGGPLEGSAPADYYEYFFEPFKPQTQFIASGIDPYNNAEMTLTLTKGSGNVKVGMLAIGDLRPMGAPLRGASVEPVDYSYISTDAFGNTTVKKRNNATGLSISAKMDIEDANSVLDTVKQVLGTPVVVVGSTVSMYEALTVFGLVSARQQYDDFGMPTINITVKGLI